jgi:uncharacterized membrane protein YgcG
MSRHLAFRRQPVNPQVAQQLRTTTFPAPTRGISMNENPAFTQPGSALIQDNWVSTMRGVRLRGGCIRWCDLHAGLSVPNTARKPIISAFEYVNDRNQRMFAGQDTALYDVTSAVPTLVKGGQTSGNYVSAQFANAGGDWMLVCNDSGDPVLRYNGTSWTVLSSTAVTAADWTNGHAYALGEFAKDPDLLSVWKCLVAHTSAATGTFEADRAANPSRWSTAVATDGAPFITGPAGEKVEDGLNLAYVWKYRNRLFFIENDSMNAWFLGIDAVGGVLQKIPLAGSASRGGSLLFGAVWSLDAGDGTDDKVVFVTTLGECLIFTGSDPSDPDNWKQEGRYQLSPPLGMNAHTTVGGDLLIMTVDGIVPISQAITKTAGQLELAMLTRTIKGLWRREVNAKRGEAWSAEKWDEYGAVFVATPGGAPGDRHCLVVNNSTGSWSRFPGYDATCFVRLRQDLFFGTQDGILMQADRSGFDDGNHLKIPYLATLVGGWETFGQPSSQVVWHQARAMFTTGPQEPFNPQLGATVDYVITLPSAPPPNAGNNTGSSTPGTAEARWDVGGWDLAHWDNVGATVLSLSGSTLGEKRGRGFGGRVSAQATPGEEGLWDTGFWDLAPWDNSGAGGGGGGSGGGGGGGSGGGGSSGGGGTSDTATAATTLRTTRWVSIGKTGFAHAPIVQVTVAQDVAPVVELLAISTTYEVAGVNVD